MPTRNREGVFTSVDEVSVSRQLTTAVIYLPETNGFWHLKHPFGIRLPGRCDVCFREEHILIVNDTVSTGFEQNLGFNGRK